MGGIIPAHLGVLTSVLTTTKRNLRMTDPLAAVFPLLPLGFNHWNQTATLVQSWACRGVYHAENGWVTGTPGVSAELPTGLTSLLAGCSTTSNLCKDPQARARYSQRAPNEPDPTQRTKALRVALLPHHTFSHAGKGLDLFISQTVSSSNHLITGIFAIYCRPLPYPTAS